MYTLERVHGHLREFLPHQEEKVRKIVFLTKLGTKNTQRKREKKLFYNYFLLSLTFSA